MEVQLAALADSANISQEGKLNILGVFDTLFAANVPTFHPLMVFVAKIRIGAGDGEDLEFRLRVVDGNGNLVAPEVRIHARGERPADGEMANFTLVLPIAGAVFRELGTYTFELRPAGGAPLAEVPLYVKPTPTGT